MPQKDANFKPVKKELEIPLWFEEKDKIDKKTWSVLLERSYELANEKLFQKSNEKGSEFLGFYWGQTRCYLRVEYIEEIRDFEYLEPVPSTPDILVGLANMRGEIVPVFDLRQLWKMPREEVTENSKLVVMDKEARKFAFWVDEVIGTFKEEDESIMPASHYSGQLNNEFTLGVLPKGEDLWMVLDPEAILASTDLVFED